MSDEPSQPLLDCELVQTRSGAPAIRDRITGELMHPVVGPLIEASQLYVKPSRLESRLRDSANESRLRDSVNESRLRAGASTAPLVLLDVGLGAGSNAITAWQVSESLAASDRRLEIVSFDRSSQALELALRDENARAFGFEGRAGVTARALLAQGRAETERTSWSLRLGELLDQLPLLAAECADIVFWDPFSPRQNPTLWTVAAFRALRRACRDGATLHTYSGATSIRSALLLAGFAVGVGHEVGELKQNTCAALRVSDLTQPLDRRWLERLRRSSAPFGSDAPSDALEQIARLPQFQ